MLLLVIVEMKLDQASAKELILISFHLRSRRRFSAATPRWGSPEILYSSSHSCAF